MGHRREGVFLVLGIGRIDLIVFCAVSAIFRSYKGGEIITFRELQWALFTINIFHLSKQLPVPLIICIWINLSWLLEIIRTNLIPCILLDHKPYTILINSDLFLLYRIEDLITPHYWSCSSELCMNFVVCILRHDFDESDSVIQTQCSIFKMIKVTFLCHLGQVVYSD